MKGIRLLFCASGQGGLFEQTWVSLKKEFPNAEAALLTQNPNSGCAKKAGALGVFLITVSKASDQISKEIERAVKNYGPDYILLAGFTRMIPENVVRDYESRILNSHPSLLPKFGGKGMYGSRVHEAVLKAGESRSGISIHLVNQEYDQGKILDQLEIPIEKIMTAAELEQKIKTCEGPFFAKVCADYIRKQDQKN